jgi:hypothetical protein
LEIISGISFDGSLTLIFARSGSDDLFFGFVVLLAIYTPLPAFARLARDTVMRRANRRVGEMGDNEYEKAQA